MASIGPEVLGPRSEVCSDLSKDVHPLSARIRAPGRQRLLAAPVKMTTSSLPTRSSSAWASSSRRSLSMLSGLRLADAQLPAGAFILEPGELSFQLNGLGVELHCGLQPGARRSTRPIPGSRWRPRGRGRERSAARSSAGESLRPCADPGGDSVSAKLIEGAFHGCSQVLQQSERTAKTVARLAYLGCRGDGHRSDAWLRHLAKRETLR